MNAISSDNYAASEDDISVIDIAWFVWRSKWLIAVMAILGGGSALIYSQNVIPTYKVEVVMVAANSENNGLSGLAGQFGGLASLAGISIPSNSSVEESIARLKSKQFLYAFVDKNNMLTQLFYKRWDDSEQRWVLTEENPNAPDLADAVNVLREILSVNIDQQSGILTLSLEWHDRELATTWANQLVAEINTHLKAKTISSSQLTIEYLERELAATTNIQVRDALFRLLEQQVKNKTLANVQEDFAFKIIDPATPPKKHERLEPKPILYILIGVFVGLLLGLALRFVYEFIRNMVSSRR